MIASLFLFANLGLICGFALASWQLSPWFLSLSLLMLLKRRHYFKLIIIFIIFSYLALWRYDNYFENNRRQSLIKYNGQKVRLRGQVIEEIDPGGNSQRLSFMAYYLDNKKISGLVLIVLPKYPEYKYGEQLEINGELEEPKNFSEFRYDRYLARYGIYSTMSYPQVKYLTSVSNIFSILLNIKNKVYQTINSALPEPEAGLANALLLGYKGTLDKEEKTSFSCCGLSHVIAISGSHLTLLSVLAFDFLLAIGLSRRRSFWPVIIFLWLYTILTGLQSSALRSAVMSTLALWGEKNGRRDAGGRLLVFAASLMLIANPFLMRDDLGFQLSFLAMIALIYFCPLGEKIFGRGEVKGILIMTVMSQLLTWPISAYNFGTFSVIAPLANLVVVWIFAWLLPASLLASVLAMIWPTLHVLWFVPSYFMLHYVVWVGNWLATWPKACLDFEISWQTVIIYYIILILAYFTLKKKFSS